MSSIWKAWLLRSALAVFVTLGGIASASAIDLSCKLGRGPSTDERVVLLSAHKGATATNLLIGSSQGATQMISVEVSPGEEGLYLLATSYDPTIWILTGAVERVRHVAVAGYYATGVVGVASTAISFAPWPCLQAESQPSKRSDLVASATRLLGSAPDLVQLGYNPYGFEVPQMNTIASADAGPVGIDPTWPTDAVKLALRYYPGGVVQLAPRSVVSNGKVEALPVLPQYWGIAQLLADGSIVPAGPYNAYRVVKYFDRYPAGLYGGFAVEFIFAKGVRQPKLGEPGHSKIKVE